ncbi:MAG: DegT/DnrJ/EryC1/StrS family aminotransferase [Lachnospiraceae bacterium]|nr:DegT/DnrJ/EryC1/StrS family aminotransferase [Lachnospiraceae bacterium]
MKKITVTKSSMPPYDEFIEKIKPLWETRWLTNMGTYHKELEHALQAYMDVPYISLMVNGHMALEMAIQAMNFPEGSEVITTPFTFISTTHAIVRNRLKPVFCDIKQDDYTIDEEKIEKLITDKTVAILPVHVYGNICNVERIKEIADKHKLKVIYDACHAFGETYKGRGIGNFGDASVFSFHATKVYNTIEGGAVTFADEALYERLYNLKNFGIRGEELVVDVGANAKMNEFSAIMGLCNLPLTEGNIALRRARAERYIELLEGEKLKVPKYHKKAVSYNYGYFPVEFSSEGVRDSIYEALKKEDIYARKYFYPLTSEASCFAGCYGKIPLREARKASSAILVLPLYPEMEFEDVERVVSVIKENLHINAIG